MPALDQSKATYGPTASARDSSAGKSRGNTEASWPSKVSDNVRSIAWLSSGASAFALQDAGRVSERESKFCAAATARIIAGRTRRSAHWQRLVASTCGGGRVDVVASRAGDASTPRRRVVRPPQIVRPLRVVCTAADNDRLKLRSQRFHERADADGRDATAREVDGAEHRESTRQAAECIIIDGLCPDKQLRRVAELRRAELRGADHAPARVGVRVPRPRHKLESSVLALHARALHFFSRRLCHSHGDVGCVARH